MKKFITEILLKYRGVIEKPYHLVDYEMLPDGDWFKFVYSFEIGFNNVMNGQSLTFAGKSENYGKAMQEAIDEAELYLKDIKPVYKAGKSVDV